MAVFSLLNIPFFTEEHFIRANLSNGYKQERAVVTIFTEATWNVFKLFNQKSKTFHQSPILSVMTIYLLNRMWKHSWRLLKQTLSADKWFTFYPEVSWHLGRITRWVFEKSRCLGGLTQETQWIKISGAVAWKCVIKQKKTEQTLVGLVLRKMRSKTTMRYTLTRMAKINDPQHQMLVM